MAKTIRMLSTYASTEAVLVAGRMYTISDQLYHTLAPYNTAQNPIFDAEPEREPNEKVYLQVKPDPGDENANALKTQKTPKFTGTTTVAPTTVAPTTVAPTTTGKPK